MAVKTSRLFAVIMAGGSGTRFWPLSREKMPKQLLRIGGEDTLIQQTVDRVLPLVRREHVFIVTNHGLADDIGMQLAARFGCSWESGIILEPEANNTAPAIGLAALHLMRIDPEAVMVVLSADHAIRKGDELLALLGRADRAAAEGFLVTLGIKPNRPETGYGYIKASAAERRRLRGRGLRRKTRPRDRPRLPARRRLLLEQRDLRLEGGDAARGARQARPRAAPRPRGDPRRPRDRREDEVIREVFGRLEPISIDYAVMEKTDRARVIPADIGWSDVGQLDGARRRLAPGRGRQRHLRQRRRHRQPRHRRLRGQAARRDHRPERTHRRRHP